MAWLASAWTVFLAYSGFVWPSLASSRIAWLGFAGFRLAWLALSPIKLVLFGLAWIRLALLLVRIDLLFEAMISLPILQVRLIV